ncbi:MAG: ATP-binding protein [Candidatus Rokuibacteriota bacterium]
MWTSVWPGTRRPTDPGAARRPGAEPGPAPIRFRVRHRLVLPGVVILVVVSFGFAALSLTLSRRWVEEDLRERAITFAREIAATIGDLRELESTALLNEQIRQILAVRRNVLQLDILTFGSERPHLVATSAPESRLPFTRIDSGRVRTGEVISRLVVNEQGRYWEVLAPIVLQRRVAGLVAAKFSLAQADRLASRIGWQALALTTASVLLMGVLMTLTVRLVVDRPIRRFMDAMARLGWADEAVRVDVRSADEFGALADHFNVMTARVTGFNRELQARVAEATGELERRYREVERLNALLFETQRSLSHAERLAIPGRIIAEVAHEIGTPLHSVAGHLELLRKDLPAGLPKDASRRLSIVEGELARVIEIIAQLLDLARPPAGLPGPVDLHQVVKDTVNLVSPGLAAAGLSLQVTADPALPKVQGHAPQLQQVLLNLLINAMDATPAGGRLEVAARQRSAGQAVELVVSDTGRGIPPDQLKLIFEPFFSTKGPSRGTGLGLFICAHIVREHEGSIDVTSEEGRGSRFGVVLPVAGAE